MLQTFGNIVNKKFTCPMGHNHKGDGYCQYTGPFRLNYFHGAALAGDPLTLTLTSI